MKIRNSSGFTLIEIMVVIVIIGIMAGMLVPQLVGSADTARLDAAARRIGDMMDYCYHTAASSGRTHAMLVDTVNRKIDIVAEVPAAPAAEGAEGAEGAPAEEGAAAAPAPQAPPAEAPPPPEAAPADPAAPATDATGAPAAPAAVATPPPSPVPTPYPDPTAPINLAPVPMPGFTDRTLPIGIAIASSETYENELSAGVNEGQFKILFFPDGTTEFAKIELATPAGQRRQVWLNGMVGSVTIIDPDREGELDLASTIIDEDAAGLAAEEGMDDQGTTIEEAPPDVPPQE